MYADVLAQCVYSTVIFAYPNSWVSFDEDFKAQLCNHITLWQEGTNPPPNSWMKWELRLLEPADLPKCKEEEEEEIGVKKVGSFDFDSLLKNARQKMMAENECANFESSFEKKLSIVDVKNALSHPKPGPMPDPKRGVSSDEKKMGVAIEQLNTLEQSSSSKVQLLTVPFARPSSAPIHHRDKDSSDSVDCRDEGPFQDIMLTCKPIAELEQSRGSLKSGTTSKNSPKRRTSQPKGRVMSTPISKPAKIKAEGEKRKCEVQAHCSKGSQHSQRLSSSCGTRRRDTDASTSSGAPLVPISHGMKYDGSLKKMALSFKKREESATLKGPDFQQVMFNLYGHSPLVKHYMDNLNLSHVNEKEIVVGRTEITKEPPQDAVCYRDVLMQSKAATENIREDFLRY